MSFSIALPAAGTKSSARKALFVPAPTTSITVSVNGTTAQTFACTTSTCSGSFLAPAGGSVNFLFNALDAASNLLAAASHTQAISANGNNVIAVTLEGVIANSTVSIVPPGLSSAASGTATVTAIAYDADGDVITGTYYVPLTMAVTDTTGTVAVTPATLTNDAASGALAYTYSAATRYIENHFSVGASASTEMSAQRAVPFVVGRTFYTFTSNSVVGFLPGATTPSRTVAIAPSLDGVTAMACDGTNLYVADGESGKVIGIAPGATGVTVSYTSNIDEAGGIAAGGYGMQPGNQAQLYVSSLGAYPYGITGFQGPISGPPFTIPPNSSTQGSVSSGRSALQIDGSGNVYAAQDGSGVMYGGYEVRDPTLNTVLATGQDNGSVFGSSQIAIDTTVSPARIYTQDNTGESSEIAEYDNYATTPSYISTDNDGAGLFVDPAGRIYTSFAAGMFHGYNAGALASGAGLFTVAGKSLAFDSASYVYALNTSGSVSEYLPGSSVLVTTFPGTTYGTPAAGATFGFGAFCQ